MSGVGQPKGGCGYRVWLPYRVWHGGERRPYRVWHGGEAFRAAARRHAGVCLTADHFSWRHGELFAKV